MKIQIMKKNIELDNKNIDYTLKMSKRARRMRLAVYCDGTFIVTAPKHVEQGIIEKFIFEKSQWILDRLNFFKSSEMVFFPKRTKTEYLKHKHVAKKLVEQKIEQFNLLYKFKFNRISIKNQKTRWGSCSSKGNLNFNYKIALLPEKMADYIIVHELCHLYEFNHSQKFWNLVARAIPDYLEIRKELKRRISL